MKSTVQNNIVLDNHPFTYIIEYKKIKNIYFRVKDDLNIHISCHPRVSIKYIENLLKENSQSIIKMYNTMLSKTKNNNDIYYLGNKLDLIITNTKTMMVDNVIYAKDLTSAKEYLYSIAYNVFLTRLESIKHSFDNLPEFKFKTRKMTSKWGVCNYRSMSVTLNTYLIEKDVHLIDYVIIHELCHFYHHNHSSSFWNEVSLHYPYYKQARKELNY